MQVLLISNYFNHHQQPVSEALQRLSDTHFYFIATGKMGESRKKLGYGIDNTPQYVLDIADSGLTDEIKRLIVESDIIIIGSASKEISNFVYQNAKLVFVYSERLLKKGYEWHKYIYRWLCLHKKFYHKRNIYLLCAGAFTMADYHLFGLFENKAYKWGYFPQKNEYDISDLISKKQRNKILWVGRLIDWKHPDDVIKVAKRLKEDGYCFYIEIGGTGEMETQLRQMVNDWHLNDCVSFLGAIPANQVRAYMEQSGIYLFTSDRQEGWGAVLNESLNSGCAVVASHAIGSVPFLIKDGENGLIYQSGDLVDLYAKVKSLLDKPQEQERLGKAAYETIDTKWNADVAAERLISLSETIMRGKNSFELFENGPCSHTRIIKNNWYKK